MLRNKNDEGGDVKNLPKLIRPYNSYNIYFTLERVCLIEARKQENINDGGRPGLRSSPPLSSVEGRRPSPTGGVGGSGHFTGYESLHIPQLPPRYEHLASVLPIDWYIPGKHKNVKRKHSKTHGLASFKEIAAIIAIKWKVVDPVTKDYVEAVANIQKDRYYELKRQAAEKAKNKKGDTGGGGGGGGHAVAIDGAAPPPDDKVPAAAESIEGTNNECKSFAAASTSMPLSSYAAAYDPTATTSTGAPPPPAYYGYPPPPMPDWQHHPLQYDRGGGSMMESYYYNAASHDASSFRHYPPPPPGGSCWPEGRDFVYDQMKVPPASSSDGGEARHHVPPPPPSYGAEWALIPGRTSFSHDHNNTKIPPASSDGAQHAPPPPPPSYGAERALIPGRTSFSHDHNNTKIPPASSDGVAQHAPPSPSYCAKGAHLPLQPGNNESHFDEVDVNDEDIMDAYHSAN